MTIHFSIVYFPFWLTNFLPHCSRCVSFMLYISIGCSFHIVLNRWLLLCNTLVVIQDSSLHIKCFFGHDTNLLININFLNGCLQRSKYIKLWIFWELHVYRQDGSHTKKGRSYPICCLTISLFSFRILNLLKDLFLQSYYNFVRRSCMQCQCV